MEIFYPVGVEMNQSGCGMLIAMFVPRISADIMILFLTCLLSTMKVMCAWSVEFMIILLKFGEWIITMLSKILTMVMMFMR